MKIKYFTDTDTALVEFIESEVAETQALSDDIYVDIGKNGELVSMTIEHAKSAANLPEVSIQEYNKQSSSADMIREEKIEYKKE